MPIVTSTVSAGMGGATRRPAFSNCTPCNSVTRRSVVSLTNALNPSSACNLYALRTNAAPNTVLSAMSKKSTHAGTTATAAVLAD